MTVSPQHEIAGIKETFTKAGVKVSLQENDTVLRVQKNGHDNDFRIPTQVEGNQGRIPGWFLAGIWDYLNLQGLNQEPDAQLLSGWGFEHAANGEWRMAITPNDGSLLIYSTWDNRLYTQYSRSHALMVGTRVEAAVFPTRSPYHAIKLFEENGWFTLEGNVLPLELDNYIIRK